MYEVMSHIKQELREKAERLEYHAQGLRELADALPANIASEQGADLLWSIIESRDDIKIMKKQAFRAAMRAYTDTDIVPDDSYGGTNGG